MYVSSFSYAAFTLGCLKDHGISINFNTELKYHRADFFFILTVVKCLCTDDRFLLQSSLFLSSNAIHKGEEELLYEV